ncbi:hypothetical protein GPALN_004208 [Globodera pallida]|nr:hypothetical protein GPALN_004208 [Globodera pallida]
MAYQVIRAWHSLIDLSGTEQDHPKGLCQYDGWSDQPCERQSTMLSSSRALTTTNVRAFGRGHTSVSTRHGTRVAPTISTTPNVAQQNDEQKF